MSDTRTELRRPFTAAAIKVKPQATTGEGADMKGLVTYYIDARLAAARLTHVVGTEWTDEYDVLIRHPEAVRVGIPVECRLTVQGVTRSDVGQIHPGECDDKAWKSAYSDAFKRAAVKFEVGAYLYGGPQVWAAVKVGRNGKAQGFTQEGAAAARQAYEKWIASKPMRELFGEALAHGDEAAMSDGATGDGSPSHDTASPAGAATQPPAPSAQFTPPADVQETLAAKAASSVPNQAGSSAEMVVKSFGKKHNGLTMGEILEKDPSHVRWLAGDEFEAKSAAQAQVKQAAQVLLGFPVMPYAGAAGGAPVDDSIPFERTI